MLSAFPYYLFLTNLTPTSVSYSREIPLRSATRNIAGMAAQSPPLWRLSPLPEPTGLNAAVPSKGACMSHTHSRTLPLISWMPQAFGRNCPTGATPG